MSTPRTDNACGWPWGHHGRIESSDLRWSPDGPFVHSEVARHLERENAALADENRRLHVELDAHHNGEQLRKLRAEVNVTRQNYESFKADNIALRAAIAESEEFARKNGETLAAKVKELLAENAALRADKKRLDWLERRTVSRLQAILDHVELHKLPIREAIDLSIKEIGQ